MRLLIDGYNLLHATDLFGTGTDAGTLQGSREALLSFLADSLSAGDRRATTIVFDASGAPPGLPQTVHHNHLTVRYAREYSEADALLEDIIERHRQPRGLVVVSSDHRVQRAARRRGAKYVDSQPWYRDLAAKQARARSRSEKLKPSAGGSVEYWVNEFATSDVEQLEIQLRDQGIPDKLPNAHGKKEKSPPAVDADTSNPFPPGYAEDLLDEDT